MTFYILTGRFFGPGMVCFFGPGLRVPALRERLSSIASARIGGAFRSARITALNWSSGTLMESAMEPLYAREASLISVYDVQCTGLTAEQNSRKITQC
jgi:hypothetical protein